MAILDIQVVATSLPTIQTRARHRAGPDELDSDRLSDRRVIAIPLTGFLTRAARHALAVRRGDRAVHRRLGRLRRERRLREPDRLARGAGLRRRHADPGGVLRRVPAVSACASRGSPPRIAGVLAVLAPTVGPVVGGWITETWSWHWLFLINVVPGIVAAVAAACLLPRSAREPGRSCGGSTSSPCCCWPWRWPPSRSALKEAPRPRLGCRARRARLLALSAASAAGFVAAHAAGAAIRSSTCDCSRDRNFARRLRPELRARRRACSARSI